MTALAADGAVGRIFPLGRRLAAPIEDGYHPATFMVIVPGVTCGSCDWWFDRGRTDGSPRSKCALAAARRGGPNLPAATPACALYCPAAPDSAPHEGSSPS